MAQKSTSNKYKNKLQLHEWIRGMRKVTNKPKLGHIYLFNDNLYERYAVPEGADNAGHHRWYRLSAKEIIKLFREVNTWEQFEELLKNGYKPEEFNINTCEDK